VLQQLSHQFGVRATRKQGKKIDEEPHKVLPFLAGLEYFFLPILDITLVMINMFKEKFFHNNEHHLEFLSTPI
jgi:hypothetical protein